MSEHTNFCNPLPSPPPMRWKFTNPILQMGKGHKRRGPLLAHIFTIVQEFDPSSIWKAILEICIMFWLENSPRAAHSWATDAKRLCVPRMSISSMTWKVSGTKDSERGSNCSQPRPWERDALPGCQPAGFVGQCLTPSALLMASLKAFPAFPVKGKNRTGNSWWALALWLSL